MFYLILTKGFYLNIHYYNSKIVCFGLIICALSGKAFTSCAQFNIHTKNYDKKQKQERHL